MRKTDELIWAGLAWDSGNEWPADANERGRIIALLGSYTTSRQGGYRNCKFYDIRVCDSDISLIRRGAEFDGLGFTCQTEQEAREKLPLLIPIFAELKITESPSIWKLYFGPLHVE